MANPNSPSGLSPVGSLSGSTSQYRVRRYAIASGYSSNIFIGDPVIFASDGVNNRIAVAAASSTKLLGVLVGVEYQPSGQQYGQQAYWSASAVTQGSADAIAYVADDPDTIFSIQVSGDFANNNVQDCANIVYATGSTSTGPFKVQLNNATFNNSVNSVEQIRVIGLWQNGVGNAYGTNAKVLAVINNHAYGRGTMGGN